MALPGDTAALTTAPMFHDNGELTIHLRYQQLGGLIVIEDAWRGGLESWRSLTDGRRATGGIADALGRMHLSIRESIDRCGVDGTIAEIDGLISARRPTRERSTHKLLWDRIVGSSMLGFGLLALLLMAS